MTKRIVIIGGGAAGPKTAAKLRRENPDYIIEMYSFEFNISYSACGLPYFIEGIIPDVNELLVRSPEEFERQGINVFLGMKAIKLYPNKNMVIFENVKNLEKTEVYYDILVLATGARPFLPKIENIDFKNVYTLHSLDNGVDIRNKMVQSKSVTIIGLGLIGLEILEAFVKNGLFVNVIDKNPHILGMFDDDISKQIQNHISERDGSQIKFYNNEYVARFEGHNGIAHKVITSNGHEIETDFIVICTGVVPNSELARDAGLKIGINNSIWVNSHLKTSNQDIYAVGDCCEKIHLVTKKPYWLPLGSTANKEGRCAALNIANKNCDFEGILGALVSRYFDYTVSMTGITERDAKSLGYEVMTTTVTHEDRAGYMPDSAIITIKLIVDVNSREIIGVQGVGTGDAEKRVSTASLAIMEATKIDDFMSLDLPYSPPFSTAIDPLLKAVQITRDKLFKS